MQNHAARLLMKPNNCSHTNRQYVRSWAAGRWRLTGIVHFLWDVTGITVQFKPFLATAMILISHT